MQILLLFALLQAPAKPVQFSSIHEKPFNDTLNLSLAVGVEPKEFLTLRVSLIDRRGPRRPRLIAEVRDRGVEQYGVERVDESSIVIARMGFYLSMQSLKLFLHPQTKAVLKQIDYPPYAGLPAVDDGDVASALGIPLSVVQQLKRKPWASLPDSSHLPRELRQHPMPQTTYAEFAKARGERVEDGYDAEGTYLEEEAGPYQIVGSRIWFGKVFYDGEGHTGVGGLGYFDTATSQYTWMNVPELAGWSVSAILIEEDAAWVGLSSQPEGEEYSGGLLRYDFKSRTSQILPVEEVVYQIVRWKDRVYVATRNGACQIEGGTLTRCYRVEPNIENRFVFVTKSLPTGPPGPR